MNAAAKIFTGLLLQRLENFVMENDLLGQYQTGFRRGYSTIDNLFVLVNIIKMKLAKKRQKIFAFFVDFKAAFDSISRNSLVLKII